MKHQSNLAASAALSNTSTMSSIEISELTGKRHDHVMTDIVKVLKELELLATDFSGTRIVRGKEARVYNLPKRECTILISGYNVKMRAAIVDRWTELESKQTLPAIQDPALLAIFQTLQEVDSLKQRQLATEEKTNTLAERVEHVEIQHRNGVPTGYLSKRHAHHLYGSPLSQDIFFRALAAMKVSKKAYIHITEEGEFPTTAFKESEIESAIQLFLDDAVQVTALTCESPMLNNKRFRFVKSEVVA